MELSAHSEGINCSIAQRQNKCKTYDGNYKKEPDIYIPSGEMNQEYNKFCGKCKLFIWIKILKGSYIFGELLVYVGSI